LANYQAFYNLYSEQVSVAHYTTTVKFLVLPISGMCHMCVSIKSSTAIRWLLQMKWMTQIHVVTG